MTDSLFLITGTYVLTDEIFEMYSEGGAMLGSSKPQRLAAYMIAEQQATDYLRTALSPVTITGTFPWPHNDYNRVMLPFVRVRAVNSVAAIFDPSTGCNESEYVACARLIQPDYGIVDLNACGDVLRQSCSNCGNSGSIGGYPFIKYRMSFTMGLDESASQHAMLRMGLVTAAKLALQQIIDPGGAEGGPGDPGITNFSDTGYSETRDGLKMTEFGMSPLSNYAARMLDTFKINRPLSLRLR